MNTTNRAIARVMIIQTEKARPIKIYSNTTQGSELQAQRHEQHVHCAIAKMSCRTQKKANVKKIHPNNARKVFVGVCRPDKVVCEVQFGDDKTIK